MVAFSQLSEEQKTELWASLALRHCKGLGLQSANALITRYGSALQAVELGRRAPGCWVSEGLLSERAARTFSREVWREKAREEWQLLQRPGVQFVYRTHSSYPCLLASISDAPLILYYKGDIRLLNNPMIGVVGSRSCSADGILACAVLSRQLASFGITIVSGLARGIDRAAHIAGLSGLGSSVAVLGTGIDVIYPGSNEDIFAILAERGLILTEFMPGVVAYPKNFPIRNRIISGLVRGVLIVEAAKRSGSLITARLALEQGRDVFAVPGSAVAKGSEGCHELIRSGAKPVFSAEDIVLDLAPLLSVDVNEQLRILRNEERPASLEQLSRMVGNDHSLPAFTDPQPHDKSCANGRDADYGHAPAPVELFCGVRQHGPDDISTLEGQCITALRKEYDEADTHSGSCFQPKGASCASGQGAPHASGHRPSVSSVTGQPRGVQFSRTAGGPPDSSCQLDGYISGLPGHITAFERQVLSLLHEDWLHIDWLSERLQVDSSAMSTTLTMLEVSGLVVQKPGMFYRLLLTNRQ